MKKIYAVILSLLALTAWAAPVGQEQAREQAVAFLAQQHNSARQHVKAVARANQDLTLTSTETQQGDALYYVFTTDAGFVIVSGDDRTEPILGYSDEGTFDPQHIPANMRYWLDGYAQQLSALSQMDDAQAQKVMRSRQKTKVGTRNSIAPLITTKWDQATPYWNKCPQFMVSDNEEDGYDLAYTGCVATSMSQVMYYYKQPEQTLAEIPAYQFTYGDGNYNYVTVQMDAQPVTTLDWAHMRETYTGAEAEVYTDAVATLMLCAGCAVKMQYGTSSSGAYTDDIPAGFKYFGYGSKIAFRTDYSQQAWEDLVYSELAAGRPMIYNGTAGSGGGHSFVCDGFQYGDYFHINWGWGGMGNGFFQLAILNPSASGIGGSSSSEGYNMKQNIIYNIIPGTATPDGGNSGDDPDEEEPVLTATAISGPSGWDREKLSEAFGIHKARIVKLSFSDHSGSGKKFKEALALYNPTDDSYSIIPGTASSYYATITTSALGQTTSFGSGIQSNQTTMKFGAGMTGNYRIVGMYQVEGSTEWKPMKESDRFYIDLNITTYAATPTYHPHVSLTTTDWSFTGDKKVGAKLQVNATIKNESEDRFFGDLYLDFGGQQIDEYSQYTTVIQAEVPAGEEKVVTFNVSPASSGTQTVSVMLPGSYSGYYNTIGSTTVTIEESAAAAEMNLSVAIEALNAEATSDENAHGDIYDSRAQFCATITNHADGEYNKYVLAPLFIVKRNDDGTIGGGQMVTYKQLPLTLAKGESKTLYFEFDNLAYGSTYSMNVYARNNVPDSEEGTHLENIVKKGESKYYNIERGIITWTGDGTRKGYKPEDGFAVPTDVAAVSLEGLSLAGINAEQASPNALYFLDEHQTAPDGLDGKNIVRGAAADAITLQDGYDFFTPQTFTAATISYERTFVQGHNNKVRTGWQTLVLPFAPEKVENATDGKPIDWFRSSTDSGKQFWLCDFAEEDGQTVYFRNAPEMQANVPYLVAVPDNAWGAKWNLVGKRIVWSASDATVKPDAIAYTSGQNMVFTGTSARLSLADILGLTADGSQFSTEGAQTVDAFHAYFRAIDDSQASKVMNIAILSDQSTGIDAMGPSSLSGGDRAAAVYDLLGRKVANHDQWFMENGPLKKGVYIIGGKKVVR